MSRLIAAALLVGCGGDPWSMNDAPKRPPDIQFRTGTEAGSDVFIWKCEAGHRIAIAKSGSPFFSGTPRMQKGPCGTPLPFESTRGPGSRSPHEIPDCCRWPGSPPFAPHDLDELLDAGPDAG